MSVSVLPSWWTKERTMHVGTSRSLQRWTLTLSVTSLAGAWVLAAAPQAVPHGTSGTNAPSGAALYLERCASCHGTSATGDGPMSHALVHVPPDLTMLSLKNNGVFPSERVHRIIEGRDVESHGNREMPVWGDVFKSDGDRTAREATRERIDAIVRYLESIQRRKA
ncbi:MAG TPA: cytochrome c [Vicinamibacterales bacterium]